MNASPTNAHDRITRLESEFGALDAIGREHLAIPGPLVGLTSSRLGHDVFRHRRACQFLTRSLLDCRDAGGRLLVASGSAIEPWTVRAAQLFSIPLIRLSVDRDQRDADVTLISGGPSKLSRDAVLIAVADRLDAVYVRRGGTVERCLHDRLKHRLDASTRVAISADGDCAAAELIAAGAIGWYLASNRCISEVTSKVTVPADADWTRTDGQWLVHCTRAREGPWPGESLDQYRDAMLVDHATATRRGPVDALEQIVRAKRLIASSVATSKAKPVVCFSAVPLSQILERRCFRPHLSRWDYEPFGIAIRMEAAKRMGIESVIYGEPKDRRALAADQRYRFHPIGKTYDWRSEREWRSRGSIDLTQLDVDDVRVFAKFPEQSSISLAKCPWRITWLS